jgi:cellulose synthase/poly-beta-1,6-N-acetylglucosamine synthase-like glycosyltransferase
VSLLVAAYNARDLVEAKIRNAFELDYPGEKLEVVFVSDGSRDGTARRIKAFGDRGVTLVELAENRGKAAALNEGFARTRGEVVVFSDVDARIAPDAVRKLVRHLADPRVGGICGRRVIAELGGLREAQSRYFALDAAVKRAESRLGRITSNDGKLYAIRRELFRPIAPGATDDLYLCLQVVRQGYRFLYEPEAVAFVPLPSRDAGHELMRRRRIVSRSLRGIFLARELLNPFRYGVFAVGLFANKVLRRLLPVFLATLFATGAVLGLAHPWMLVLLAAQVTFYAAAALHPLVRHRTTALCHYFCVGNLGTLLGLVDFLRRRETVRWEPRKAG